MSVNTYIKEATKNVKLELAKSVCQLFKIAISPIKMGYRPELDLSPVLEDD